jgi:hypothetical protein
MRPTYGFGFGTIVPGRLDKRKHCHLRVRERASGVDVQRPLHLKRTHAFAQRLPPNVSSGLRRFSEMQPARMDEECHSTPINTWMRFSAFLYCSR